MLDIFGKLKVIFKENKRIMIIICATTLIASICAGTTVALLTAVSGPVENVFTIGNIDLELAETTGNSYKMIPGHSIKKDPTVTVKTGSEDCWLFIKIDKTEGFDNYFSYQLEDGWTHLGGFDGVYYRSIVNVKTNVSFNILKNNSITVRDDLTEEKMSAITSQPQIVFTAYAVQSYTVETAAEAWIIALGEGKE